MALAEDARWWVGRYAVNLGWALGLNLLFLVAGLDSYTGPVQFVLLTLALSLLFLGIDVAHRLWTGRR